MAIVIDTYSFCGCEFAIKSDGGKSFTTCFETVVFVLLPFILLAGTSSYCIGYLRPPDVRLRIPGMFESRKNYSLFTLILAILAFFKDVIVCKCYIPVVLLSHIVRIISLCVHTVYLSRLCLIHFEYLRGPLCTSIAWLLTFPFYGVALERITSDLFSKFSIPIKPDETLNDSGSGLLNDVCLILDFFLYVAMFSCQFMYFVTIVQKNAKYKTVSIISDSEERRDNFHSIQNILYNTSAESLADETCPSQKANCISVLFFHWVQFLMKLGKRELLVSPFSTYQLPSELKTESLCHAFIDDLSKERLASASSDMPGNAKPKRTLLKVLRNKFGKQYYLCGLLKFLGDMASFAGPVLLNLLVGYVETPGEPIRNGALYAAGLFLTAFVQSIFSTHFEFQVNKIGIGAKSAMVSAVFGKTLTSKPASFAAYSTGEVTNLMNTDVDRIVNFFPSFHQFWSLPLQVIITLVLLYLQVGWIFLGSLAVGVVMIIFNRYLAIKIGAYNRDMMKHKDDRVKLMTEILLGIRTVKNHAWEDVLGSEINRVRSKELKSLRGLKYFDAGCVYLWATTPLLISLFTFSLYSVLGYEDLSAAKVFTVIALINMLIFPLNAFPWVINGLMEALTSLQRLEKFLNVTESELEQYYDQSPMNKNDDAVCVLQDASFCWGAALPSADNSNQEFQLKDLNIRISRGQLVGVVGPVGCGKTSLLMAIAGELNKIGGQIYVENYQDGVAYVTQEAWLQHATIRQNIIWNLPYHDTTYTEVVDACALIEDFNNLPEGDETEIGENGVTLSGGQKARISLARAIYQNKSIYLLDDPFSALDQETAHHIFVRCITGLLSKKTVILATHHLKYLKSADFVLSMDNGRAELVESETLFSAEESTSIQNMAVAAASSGTDLSCLTNKHYTKPQMLEEDKAFGSINFRVYKTYWKAVGNWVFISILLFVALMRGSKVASDWWLSQWVTGSTNSSTNGGSALMMLTSSPSSNYTGQFYALPLTETSYTFLLSPNVAHVPAVNSTMWYLMIYGIIAAGNSVVALIRSFMFAYGGLRAADRMHKDLLKSILNTPVSYFDMTPIGRIVNRFSSDMYTIDDSLPFILNSFLSNISSLFSTILVTCYGVPLFTTLLLPLSVCYYFVQNYYRHTSRELKRFTSITLSPLYAHFHETILGLHTILAYRRSDIFRKQNMELINTNQRCRYSSVAAIGWLSIRLKLMGTVIIGGVAVIAVVQNAYSPVTAGLVGLALSYALSITNNLSSTITTFTETEKEMVAVERQSYYIEQIPHERSVPHNRVKLPSRWPNGEIEFRSVSLRYPAQLTFALDDINFKINPGEKIGIIGRTGSGKTSLFTCLFRLKTLSKGAVYIDGVNISKVCLKDLRSKITIIRQDPFLFSSSVRLNLDPEKLFDDTELWWALECCGLLQVVQSLGGLDVDIGEKGRKLSVGQRQLLSLARGLLKKTKILCLDEATANIDEESERIAMEAISKHFTDCTILSIAHRMKAVKNYDKILLMENGQIKSFTNFDTSNVNDYDVTASTSDRGLPQ